MRMWWAEAMAAAMRRGQFMTTHQGIAFTDDGELLDGQHRLKAIQIYGQPVEMLCVYGLEKAAFAFIDIGVKRSVSDVTHLHKRTAEVCRMAAHLLYGGTTLPDQVIEIAKSGLAEVHDRLHEHCGSNSPVTSAAPVRLAACALVMDGYHEEDIFSLYRKMVLLEYGDLPPSALAFLKQKESRKLSSANSYELLARALKAISPETRNISKIQVDEGAVNSALSYVRQILRRATARRVA